MKNRALLIGLLVVLSAMLILVIGFWEPQGPPTASSVGQQGRLATAAPRRAAISPCRGHAVRWHSPTIVAEWS